MLHQKKIKTLSFLLLTIANKCIAGSFYVTTVRQKTTNLAEIYYFYPDQQKILDITTNASNASIDNMDTNHTLKILIHGWIANRDHVAMEPIKHAYLSKGERNLLVVDWSKTAALFYPDARKQVYKVGLYIGEVLNNFFTEKNVQLDGVHLIGHSLGAHIAGNIGKYFKGKIGRITALDPAEPMFEVDSFDSIMQADAKFVDVIHTAIGTAGQKEPKGHIDFYPNRGYAVQPGCESLDILTLGSCSHYRAPNFFAESILNPTAFPAVPCDIEEIENGIGKCDMMEDNGEDIVYMGESVSKKASGVYYLETFNLAPFGKGVYAFATK